MAAREEFYRALRTDYEKNGSRSVIYTFLEREHERLYERAGSGERDFLVRLRRALEDMEAGRMTARQHAAFLLRAAARKWPKLPRQFEWDRDPAAPLPPAADPAAELADLAGPLLGREAAELAALGKAAFRAALVRAAETLEREDGPWARAADRYGPARARAWTDMLAAGLTHGEVRDFFYDAGWPLEPRGRYGELRPREGPRQGRAAPRQDKTMRLLEDYCRRTGVELFGAGRSDEECRRLYGQCLRRGDTKVLSCLRTDGKTGCALYVVGRDYFDRAARPRRSCAYGILALDTYGGLACTLLDSQPMDSLEEALGEYELSCYDAAEELARHGAPLEEEPTAAELDRERALDREALARAEQRQKRKRPVGRAG